jgi:DNA polymerase I-like protein with 3'-5' exonuclease and polymerase domains
MKLCLDFETHPIIDGRLPPKPVGLAYAMDDGPVRYIGRHKNGEPRAREMRGALLKAWHDPQSALIGHGIAFDLAVARHHLDLPSPRAQVHDTMVQAFLLDPFARDLGLKEICQRYGIAPKERDALREYLQKHHGVRASVRWGREIHRAPDSRIAPYAKADVRITRTLYRRQTAQLLALRPSDPRIRADAVMTAYRRECDLLLVLVEMRLAGLPIDESGLRVACERWTLELHACERWLRERLGFGIDDKLTRAQKVMAAAEARGLVTRAPRTEKGNYQSNLEALEASDLDRTFLAVWRARMQRQKAISTYALPWLLALEANGDGRLHCEWLGTRGTEAGRRWGARTGRMASSPNLQNIPKAMEVEYETPPELKLGPPPQLRQFIRPPVATVILQRDYSQQELRVLAHYEDGDLRKLYMREPRADVHEHTRLLIQSRAGLILKRDQTKTTGFSILYGTGVRGLARRLKVSEDEATDIRRAYYRALPGIKTVDGGLRKLAAEGKPYWTWGGRPYHVETTKETFEGWGHTSVVTRTWEYKALNYLIQGSSADCTKEAMLRYWRHPERRGQLVSSIHDELWVLCSEAEASAEMDLLRQCMESVEFSVPMLTDGVVCRESVAEAKA